MTTERWLPIPGYDGYEVSDQGHVRSMRRSPPKVLTPWVNPWGYTNAAKTHCPQNHPYDETNTFRTRGRRCCRACRRESDRRRRSLTQPDAPSPLGLAG